jgi:uncharacterized membrane protein (DUF2068 family)
VGAISQSEIIFVEKSKQRLVHPPHQRRPKPAGCSDSINRRGTDIIGGGMPTSDEIERKPTAYGLVAIGVFKLVKSALLLGLGIGLIFGRNRDLGQVASHWIDAVWVGRPLFDSLFSKLSSLNQRTLEHAAAGSFVYSALLLVEGIGLCCKKRWAEFLTVAITASLLPFEIYALFHRLTATRVGIMIVNAVILWYLLRRLLRARDQDLSD